MKLKGRHSTVVAGDKKAKSCVFAGMKVKGRRILMVLGSFMEIGKSSSTDRAILADIEAAVARCTDGRSDDGERGVQEILFLVSNAPGSITFLWRRITARLAAARTAVAAVRCLLLVHRLLRAGDRHFEQDFRNLYDIADVKLQDPFVRLYASYLEERMGWMINQAGNLEPARPCHGGEARSSEALLFTVSMCQRLLDRVTVFFPDDRLCSASPAAQAAFGIVLRESFRVYDTFSQGLHQLLAADGGVSAPCCDGVVIKKAAEQAADLREFYQCCRKSSAGKALEYPQVRLVTPELSQLEKTRRRKMETTISTVWVEFDKEEQQQPPLQLLHSN